MIGHYNSPLRKTAKSLPRVRVWSRSMARAALSPRVEPLQKLRNSRTSRSSISSKISRRWAVVSGHDMIPSAAGFRLRDVSFDLVEIGAEHSSDEAAPAIVNVNLWNGVDVELLRHGCSPVDDVDLAQRNLRIASRHLFQARREPSTGAAPVRIKFEDGHIAQCQMLVDVHLRTMRDHFDRLSATSDGRRHLIDCLLRRVSRSNRRVVMKAFLLLFRQLDEVNLRDARFGSEHDAVRFDSANRGVFVFSAVNQFEVIGQRNRPKTEDQSRECLHLKSIEEF